MTDKFVFKELSEETAVSKKSLPQQLSHTQLYFVSQKTPPIFIEKRKGPGGMILDYVEVGYINAQLNSIFGHGGWDFECEIVDALTNENEVTVKGKLTCKIQADSVKHEIVKEQFGSAQIKRDRVSKRAISMGDDAKAAASDAMKKCASLIGIAADVYAPKFWDKVNEMRKANDQLVESR